MNSGTTHIILLSGPTGVGKTTLAQELIERIGALYVSTSSLIASFRPSLLLDRDSLQRAGNALDQETEFLWIANEVAKLERKYPDRSIVVDAVRKPEQILAIREQTNSDLIHVHLEASYEHVSHRHSLRSRDIDSGQKYDVLVKDVSESYQSELASISDLKLDTENASPFELRGKVISFLNAAIHN